MCWCLPLPGIRWFFLHPPNQRWTRSFPMLPHPAAPLRASPALHLQGTNSGVPMEMGCFYPFASSPKCGTWCGCTELLYIYSPGSCAASEVSFLMNIEIYSMQENLYGSEHMFLVYVGSEPPLASKHTSIGFSSSWAEFACLYLVPPCFGLKCGWKIGTISLNNVKSPGPKCASIRLIILAQCRCVVRSQWVMLALALLFVLHQGLIISS